MNSFDISKSVEEFKNRTIYKEFTPEILAGIPDHQLEQAIIDFIDAKHPGKLASFIDIEKMSTGFQIIFSTRMLQNEVNNGGFNQFFTNPSGQFADMALRSLENLNAMELYRVVENAKAIQALERKHLLLRLLHFMKKSKKAFIATYRFSSLGKCDEEFYKSEENLSEKRIHYIRGHINEFIGN
jgi:hypothetical protein